MAGEDNEDKQTTAERIAQAAIDEFTEHGYAGARMERIASRAGCTKGMLYHHYGGKRELWSMALSEVLTAKRALHIETLRNPGNPIDTIMAIFTVSQQTEEHGRLLMWEQLEADAAINADERRAHMDDLMMEIEGIDDEELRPTIVLAMLSAAIMPNMLPQFTRIITGKDPDDPELYDQYRRALQWLMQQAQGSGRDDDTQK
ncbi:MAG: TetR/AcrR family transcriptional regulator [Myxococcota bacterium]